MPCGLWSMYMIFWNFLFNSSGIICWVTIISCLIQNLTSCHSSNIAYHLYYILNANLFFFFSTFKDVVKDPHLNTTLYQQTEYRGIGRYSSMSVAVAWVVWDLLWKGLLATFVSGYVYKLIMCYIANYETMCFKHYYWPNSDHVRYSRWPENKHKYPQQYRALYNCNFFQIRHSPGLDITWPMVWSYFLL